MKLIEINKNTYRKRLNIIIVAFIATFLVLSLGFGQAFILMFADGIASSQTHSNFRYNLLGVILALVTCAAILHQLRNSEFFHEVYYVWQLKQVINAITRKLTQLKKLAQQNDRNALIILNYYYQAMRQVYQLDDNTITLSTINKEIEQLTQQIDELNLELSFDDFSNAMLNKL